MLTIYEYKVIGSGTVTVTEASGTTNKSLHEAITRSRPDDVASVLNELGKDGWEPVLLSPPYIFKRTKKEPPKGTPSVRALG